MIRRSTDYIVLHCSATPPKVDIGAADIRQWHTAKGWTDIGYHCDHPAQWRDRAWPAGNQVGSHVKSHNANSLGVCLVGGTDARQRPQDNFTPAQWAAFKRLLRRAAGSLPARRHPGPPGLPRRCQGLPVLLPPSTGPRGERLPGRAADARCHRLDAAGHQGGDRRRRRARRRYRRNRGPRAAASG